MFIKTNNLCQDMIAPVHIFCSKRLQKAASTENMLHLLKQ